MNWTRPISADRSYHLVNLSLAGFFLLVLCASLLPDGTVQCQRQAAGLDCIGCGTSRSFRALLTTGEYPITMLGLRLFFFCVGQLALRMLSSAALIMDLGRRRMLCIDLSISIPALFYSFWPALNSLI